MNTWHSEPAGASAGGAAQFVPDQNHPSRLVGSTSLPADPYSSFLERQDDIRIVSNTALPEGNRSSIKQAEYTYGLMMSMSQALGQNCTFCHNTRSFTTWAQSSPQRVLAWHGIRMVRDLNVSYPLKPVLPANRLGQWGRAEGELCDVSPAHEQAAGRRQSERRRCRAGAVCRYGTLEPKNLGYTPWQRGTPPMIPRAIAVLAAVALLMLGAGDGASAEDQEATPCNEEAMLVFDASGSMAGNEMLGIATTVTRIDKVRRALATVLPSVTRARRVGLISYGPGPYNQCNVELNIKPRANAADAIMSVVNGLVPAGKTPLAAAVREAADVLDYTNKPGLIVVLTDGEETCGGQPCKLAKQLHAKADQLTIHVIGFRVRDFSWTGEQSVLDIMCLAQESGGLYITAQSEDELVEALEKTLGCPMMSQGRGRLPRRGTG